MFASYPSGGWGTRIPAYSLFTAPLQPLSPSLFSHRPSIHPGPISRWLPAFVTPVYAEVGFGPAHQRAVEMASSLELPETGTLDS
jgi:hypothetical protein